MIYAVRSSFPAAGAARRRRAATPAADRCRSLLAVAVALSLGAAAAARASDTAVPRSLLPESAWGMLAEDPATGQVGVAFASSTPLAAPTYVAHEEGAGVAIVLPATTPGESGGLLRELAKGRLPERAARRSLAEATFGPQGAAAIVSAKGEAWVSAATGAGIVIRSGVGFAIVANRVASISVVEQMEKVFTGARGPLPGRMLAALQAGQEAGGGALPARSALVWVSRSAKAIDAASDGRGIDLRVDEHPFPILSLQGLARLWRQERAVGQAVALGEEGDWSAAARSLGRLAATEPTQGGLFYLLATTLSRSGDTAGALGALKRTVHLEPALADLARSDPAFAPLAPDPEFQALVGMAEPGK